MARAIWRGAISFGMVSIPVKLYTATESKDVSFRQLAAEDLKPIKYLRWSPTLDREVEYGEIVKGYEYAKDQFVIIDDEDFEKLPVPSKHTIQITQFVQSDEIDPVSYEKAYYLDPDEVGIKPYALLLKAMAEKGLVAIGKLALRQKEHLVVLRPQGSHITIETLFYPDEIRAYDGVEVADVDVSKQELQMAFALIDMLHEPFDASKYSDDYRDTLMQMITAKLEGGEVVVAEEEAPAAQTVDLMAALRASIEATKARKEKSPAAEEGAPKARARKASEKAPAKTSTRTRKKAAAS